jgi:hypothetical protein
MALYSNAADPGNWQSFLIREDVKSLSPAEQKKKYLTEQLQFEDFLAQQRFLQSNSLNQLNNQLHQGGNIAGNKVKEVFFNSQFPVDYNNTSTLKVDFFEPVQVVGGIPFINVINGQQGGGSAPLVRYDYTPPSSSATSLVFSHSHPANAGGVDVDVISVGADLVSGGIVVQPTAAIPGDYLAAAYTTDSVEGTGVVFTAVIDGGQQLVELNVTTAGSGYKVGDIFTFANDALGVGSTGGSVTVTKVNLTGDTLTLAGTAINENGGEIYNVGDNINVQLNLDYTSTSNITAFIDG